jgi:hypothetical protein
MSDSVTAQDRELIDSFLNKLAERVEYRYRLIEPSLIRKIHYLLSDLQHRQPTSASSVPDQETRLPAPLESHEEAQTQPCSEPKIFSDSSYTRAQAEAPYKKARS